MNNETQKNPNDSELQNKIMRQIRDLGDSLERAGERIERSGWEKIGQAIYRLGDTLEHLNDKKARSGGQLNKESDSSKNYGQSAGASKTDSFSSTSAGVGPSTTLPEDKDNLGSNIGGSKESKGFVPPKKPDDASKSKDNQGSRAY